MTELDVTTKKTFDDLQMPNGRWSARDLQPFAGYSEWRKFEGAIERAKTSVANAEGVSAAQHHFVGADKSSPQPNGGFREIRDYHLTRYAAYLVFMNGDPRKSEIANAQAYFAIKTREAETGLVMPQSFADALELAAKQQREIENKARELEEARPKVTVYDRWLTSDAIEMTDFAKRIGISPPKFTELLRNVGILRKDRRRDGKFRNLPTEAWKSAFDVRPRQLDNGRWLDLALLNPQGQVDVLEELHRLGMLDILEED